jgi:hypothetical protein
MLFDIPRGALRQIVDSTNAIPFVQESAAQVGADEPR